MAEEMELHFNQKKCYIMRMSRSKNPRVQPYTVIETEKNFHWTFGPVTCPFLLAQTRNHRTEHWLWKCKGSTTLFLYFAIFCTTVLVQNTKMKWWIPWKVTRGQFWGSLEHNSKSFIIAWKTELDLAQIMQNSYLLKPGKQKTVKLIKTEC